MSDVPIRAASTVILWRAQDDGLSVLMGMRGAKAVFMPSKYVFPGGAVDADDHADGHLSTKCHNRLYLAPLRNSPAPEALAACALRELAEEAGLHLAPGAPLTFFFRAITPAGSPRRFDARFFLANATDLLGNPDDFQAATDELTHLHWIALKDVRQLNLPFITEVVLAEVQAFLSGYPQHGVPFFDNSGPDPAFRRLI